MDEHHDKKEYKILMVTGDLAAAPEYELPSPFGFEFYKPGYEAHWIRIHDLADKYNKVDVERFNQEFRDYQEELGKRQLFLLDGNREIIGTSTAWSIKDGRFKDYGMVHWIAIIPGYQGKGLGKALLCHTLQLLKGMGYTKGFLGTDTRRENAVAMYKKFGFKIIK